MAEDIKPPTNPLAKDGADTEALIREFNKRLVELEASKESLKLSFEDQYRDLLKKEIEQRINMREHVVMIAIIVMALMSVVLLHGAHTYLKNGIMSSLTVAMFVAPIVSITSVTIMLLVGAFRRFKDDDISNVNVSSLAAEVAKNNMAS